MYLYGDHADGMLQDGISWNCGMSNALQRPALRLDHHAPLSDITDMYQVETTAEFDAWLDELRDHRAQAKIAQRLVRIEAGLLGDWKTVGDGVSEIRIDFGPGYRLYFTIRRQIVVVLLCGSDKRDQKVVMKRAKDLSKHL